MFSTEALISVSLPPLPAGVSGGLQVPRDAGVMPTGGKMHQEGAPFTCLQHPPLVTNTMSLSFDQALFTAKLILALPNLRESLLSTTWL